MVAPTTPTTTEAGAPASPGDARADPHAEPRSPQSRLRAIDWRPILLEAFFVVTGLYADPYEVATATYIPSPSPSSTATPRLVAIARS